MHNVIGYTSEGKPQSDEPDGDPGAAPDAALATRPRARRPRSRGGHRSVTIEDVAARADVSIATVSRVLTNAKVVRPETRRRVVQAVEALGYRPSGPARALARSRTHTLGLIMTDLAQPFYAELTRAVETASRAHGYTVVLANGAGDTRREADYLDLLAERRVDGILVASWGITQRHVDWLAHAPVEVVLVSCMSPELPLPAILSASRDGARVAAAHLLGLGHRRLAEITGPPDSAAATDRHRGVLDALAEAGLHEAELAVAHCQGDFESGARATAVLLHERPRPTAVICYNDLVAAGALRAARDAGLQVPRDLSVVGFDDVPLARMVEPALTTVAQPVAEMGRWAVERIVAALATAGNDGETGGVGRATGIEAAEAGAEGRSTGTEADVIRMPCHLIVRDSTARSPDPVTLPG
jgi:LacI family transcriptional regulator